jgi:type II secretory pathway component PulJ
LSSTLDIDATALALDAAGVTLPDVLVACALSGLVLAGTYSLIDQGLRAYTTGAARVETQEAARAAIERLSRELRLAGRGPSVDMPAFVAVEPARVVITADLDADGDSDARGELVTWELAGSVLRRDAGGGAQPVVNGVRAFALRYFDATGDPTTNPDAVRSVEVTLWTAPAAGETAFARGVGTTLHTRVRLRNR